MLIKNKLNTEQYSSISPLGKIIVGASFFSLALVPAITLAASHITPIQSATSSWIANSETSGGYSDDYDSEDPDDMNRSFSRDSITMASDAAEGYSDDYDSEDPDDMNRSSSRHSFTIASDAAEGYSDDYDSEDPDDMNRSASQSNGMSA